MDIKKLLKIVVLSVAVVSIFFSLSIYIALDRYSNATDKVTVVNNIVLEVFQRRVLGDEYLLSQSDRAKLQWFAKQEALKKEVAENESDFSSEKEQLVSLKEGLVGSENIFKQVVALHQENMGSTPSALFLEKKAKLSTQLTIKAQETISAASTIASINNSRAHDYLQNIIFLFSSVASIFFTMLIVGFFIIWRSANKLEESEERFQFVAKATNDAIYDWNISTNSITFGEGMYKLFGYTKDQVIETLEWWSSQVHPEDIQKVNALLDQALASSNESFWLEYRFKKANGTYADVVDKAFLVRNRSGKAVRYIGVMQDHTREKELERMKDEFVSVASHELRTPMGAIKSLVSMIFEGDYGPVNEQLKEPLTDIKNSTERLIRLVGDMLNVSRIEAGRLKFSLVDTQLQPILQEVVALLSPIASEKKISLVLGDVINSNVQADIDKVKQILNNLIGNSLKFTDTGSITISSRQIGNFIEIYVKDTGMGISKEDGEKLFTKFKQIESRQSGRPAGSGLGLYISRELTKKMGGEMRIAESSVGQGTTFAFTLPVSGTQEALNAKQKIGDEASAHPDQKSN